MRKNKTAAAAAEAKEEERNPHPPPLRPPPRASRRLRRIGRTGGTAWAAREQVASFVSSNPLLSSCIL
eukprot:2763380-Rhodomonas_salina.1